MSLTVDGFAPERTVPLRGKGGTRQRGDNGVSPLPPTAPLPRTLPPAPTPTLPPSTKRTLPPAPTPSLPPAPTRTLPLLRTRPRARPRPAALEWQDARLPVLGRLWATAWLPAVLVAGCLVALMYLLQTSGVATTGYDIQRLQTERDDWQLRNEQLRLELAKRRSLTWIEAEATRRLGMVRPDPTALTYVKASR